MRDSKFTGMMLSQWRMKKGWKRTFLASQLGISVTTLWSWEKLEFVPLSIALSLRAVDMNLKPMGE